MTITDSTPAGEKIRSFTLDSLTERTTVREIIRARIWQEVQDYNQKCDEVFAGFVQPTGAERTLNGYRVKERRVIDWEQQFKHACEGFQRNGFFVLIDDQQADSLDDEFAVRVDSEVQFVKLTALNGQTSTHHAGGKRLMNGLGSCGTLEGRIQDTESAASLLNSSCCCERIERLSLPT